MEEFLCFVVFVFRLGKTQVSVVSRGKKTVNREKY